MRLLISILIFSLVAIPNWQRSNARYDREVYFGKPISNFEPQEDLTVQYFQRARFELRPGYPQEKRVVVSDLGTNYFTLRGENLTHLLPDPGEEIIQGILDLKVRAFPMRAVTGKSGNQTVFVIVQDQRLLPVSNAQISLVVSMPDGKEMRYIVPTLTDQQGVTKYTFPFKSISIGIVTIEATATHKQIENDTSTSFRIWW